MISAVIYLQEDDDILASEVDVSVSGHNLERSLDGFPLVIANGGDGGSQIMYVDFLLPPTELPSALEASLTLRGETAFWNIDLTSLLFGNGDCDGDGDIDLEDYVLFNQCAEVGSGDLPPECPCADFDNASDVNLLDFAAFQRAFNGSQSP